MRRIFGLLEWLALFIEIFNGRSNKTYGKRHIANIYKQFQNEFLVQHQDITAAESSIKQFCKNINLVNLGKLTRIGPKHDAGYIGLDMFQKPLIISGGAGKNIEFETFFASRGSVIDLYDPTIKKLNFECSNITHYDSALEGYKSGKFRKTINLDSALRIIKSKGTLSNHGIYLKIDIEGSEWELLEKSFKNLKIFDQIFVEFHDLHKLTERNFRLTYTKVNKFLASNFYIVAISANNWNHFVNFGKSFTPQTYEVTYINKVHKKLLVKNKLPNFKKSIYPNNKSRPLIYNQPFFME